MSEYKPWRPWLRNRWVRVYHCRECLAVQGPAVWFTEVDAAASLGSAAAASVTLALLCGAAVGDAVFLSVMATLLASMVVVPALVLSSDCSGSGRSGVCRKCGKRHGASYSHSDWPTAGGRFHRGRWQIDSESLAKFVDPEMAAILRDGK